MKGIDTRCGLEEGSRGHSVKCMEWNGDLVIW